MALAGDKETILKDSILPVWLVPVAFVFATLTYVVLAMYRSDLLCAFLHMLWGTVPVLTEMCLRVPARSQGGGNTV